ncbi:calcium-binding protein [Rhizorhabdus wittichii]|nr:calcium-binding protein [Rhizorhabdus wittichii]
MTWSAVLATIHFYDGTETWADPVKMTAMSAGEKASFLAKMEDLYDNSPTFAATMDNFSTNGDVLGGTELNIIGAYADPNGAVASNLEISMPGGNVNTYFFQMDDLEDSVVFNTNGKLIHTNASLTIAHELYHGITGYQDPDPADAIAVQNADLYDFDGPQVIFQNAVAADMGWGDQLRASYMGQVSEQFAIDAGWTLNHNYSLGAPIDEMRYGDITGDLIDHTAKTDDAHDLIFSLWGDDTVKGGGGNDHIWGGLGNDLIEGNAGQDLLVGEEGDDTLVGGNGADFLVSGTGNDVLDGGAGDDLIVMQGGSGQATGGDGNDIFWFDLGTVKPSITVYDYTLVGGDPGDSIIWNGYVLEGGPFTILDREGGYPFYNYLDDHGIIYFYAFGTSAMIIGLPTNELIYIDDFTNGDYGITFSEPPPHEDLAYLPVSNIVDNDEFGDWYNLAGRSEALETPGSIPDPWPFS